MPDPISREELQVHLELLETKSNLRGSALEAKIDVLAEKIESKIDRLIEVEKYRNEIIDSKFDNLSKMFESFSIESKNQIRDQKADNKTTRHVLFGFIITVILSIIATILTIISIGESIKSTSSAQIGNIIGAMQTGVSLGGGFVESNEVKAPQQKQSTENQASSSDTAKPKS